MDYKSDEKRVKSLLNKHIIIGLTYLDENEEIIERIQLHGIIIQVNKNEGVLVKLNNSDEEYNLPPDLSAIHEAPPGEYHFKTTGEVIINPDLMTTWTIHKSSSQE